MNSSSITVLLMLAGIVWFFISYFRKIKKLNSISSSTQIVELTSETFEKHISQGVTLVDFWADWCMPCKMMVPILNETVEKIPQGTSIAKINIEWFRDVAVTYSVRSIPTMILFKDGQEKARFVGVKSKDFLLKEISKFSCEF